MDVARAIEGAVARNPAMKTAHWGMVVRDGQGRVLYQHNPDDLFVPASNLKLITASTATHRLGADHRFVTRLLADGTVDSQGILHGDVYLQGTGDPSLTTADLQTVVQHLPFHQVDGRIRVDDSAFDNVHTGPGWAPGDLSQPYGAESDAVTLDENVATLTVTPNSIEQPSDSGYLTLHNSTTAGPHTELQAERQFDTNDVTVTGTVGPQGGDVPITVHDPGLYAVRVLKSLLHASGDVDKGPARGRVVWEHASPTLLELERHMLKESDNLYAETLFHALAGGQSAQAPTIERQTLHLGRPTTIVDGSGLSPEDRLSPALLCDIVRQEYRDPGLRSCLPVADVDGTLIGRMPELKGKVEAKTGTMTGVSSLSGWLGPDVAFSWTCDHYPGPMAEEKTTEDAVVVALAQALTAGQST